jgi:hypothetical protein
MHLWMMKWDQRMPEKIINDNVLTEFCIKPLNETNEAFSNATGNAI